MTGRDNFTQIYTEDVKAPSDPEYYYELWTAKGEVSQKLERKKDGSAVGVARTAFYRSGVSYEDGPIDGDGVGEKVTTAPYKSGAATKIYQTQGNSPNTTPAAPASPLASDTPQNGGNAINTLADAGVIVVSAVYSPASPVEFSTTNQGTPYLGATLPVWGTRAHDLNVEDLLPSRRMDVELAGMAQDVAKEMRLEKWKPSNSDLDGAFGKEFERRIFSRINANPNRGANRLLTDVVTDQKGKVVSIGTGPGAKGTTQFDIIYYKGNLKVGDTIDQGRVIGNYDVKTGRTGRFAASQVARQAKVTGRPVRHINTPEKWSRSLGWHKVDSVQKNLKRLGAISTALTVWAIVSSEADAREIDHLIRERVKAGSDLTAVQNWVNIELQQFLMNQMQQDAAAAKAIGLWVFRRIRDDVVQ